MIITVQRLKQTDDSTMGALFIDNVFQCFTLENPHNKPKIPGVTRIPTGIYPVGLRTVGGKYQQYSDKYPGHEGMLHIQDVPEFTNILIHIGNHHNNTDGCILVGKNAMMPKYDYVVGDSMLAYLDLYDEVISSARSGNLQIKIIDELTKPVIENDSDSGC